MCFCWHRLNACHFAFSQCQNGQWPDNGIAFIPPLERPLLRFEFMVFRSANLDIIGFFPLKLWMVFLGIVELFFCLFRFIPPMCVSHILVQLFSMRPHIRIYWLAKKLCARNCCLTNGINIEHTNKYKRVHTHLNVYRTQSESKSKLLFPWPSQLLATKPKYYCVRA